MVMYGSIRRVLSLLVLSGTLSLPALAEPLDLAAAMGLARQSSPEVAAASARHDAARARAREAAAHRLPQVRVSESWIRTDSPADAFGLLLNQERFSFPAFVARNPNDPDPLATTMTRIEIEAPIFTGGELSARVAQARLGADAARWQTARVTDQAALGAAQSWIDLAQAREALRLATAARQSVAAHRDLAAAYTDQGMLVRSDLLRAEVELARIDDLIAEAIGREHLAESMLSFRLGATAGSRWELAEIAVPPAPQGELAVWQRAALGRADLEAARLRLQAGELETRARRAGLFPQIGASARHDWYDDRLFGTHGDSTTISASARLQIFDGGKRRAAVAAARAEAAAGKTDLARFEDAVRLEVQQAWESAQVAQQRQTTAAAALAAANENSRIVEDRFRAGVMRSLDVLDAVTARREAEMRELVARADAWRGRLALAAAAGQAPESAVPSATTPFAKEPAS